MTLLEKIKTIYAGWEEKRYFAKTGRSLKEERRASQRLYGIIAQFKTDCREAELSCLNQLKSKNTLETYNSLSNSLQIKLSEKIIYRDLSDNELAFILENSVPSVPYSDQRYMDRFWGDEKLINSGVSRFSLFRLERTELLNANKRSTFNFENKTIFSANPYTITYEIERPFLFLAYSSNVLVVNGNIINIDTSYLYPEKEVFLWKNQGDCLISRHYSQRHPSGYLSSCKVLKESK